jgi:uncharacterized protein YqjF (DUF2071 family)
MIVHGKSAIDRLTPCQRPKGRPAGYQRWRSLLFLHWPVPVELLVPLVPAELAIDADPALMPAGTAWVGVVAFAMEGVRFRGMPEAVALDFLETNVRTYVLGPERKDGTREPGVFFFSLDAASRLAVRAARMFYAALSSCAYAHENI